MCKKCHDAVVSRLYENREGKKGKVYCFVNGDCPGLLYVLGLSEDGLGLAGHASSDVHWAKHDIGITSDWKHDNYKKYYPEGFELIWLDDGSTLPQEVKDAAEVLSAKVNATCICSELEGETTKVI